MGKFEVLREGQLSLFLFAGLSISSVLALFRAAISASSRLSRGVRGFKPCSRARTAI